MSRPHRSTFSPVDLLLEAAAGILQRPSRSILTVLGTVLGVGAFVAILGLTTTASSQIGGQFDALRQTMVTVTDVGKGHSAAGASTEVDFPADADARICALNGAVAAGVYWSVPLAKPTISNSLAASTTRSTGNALPIYAASAGVFAAAHVSIRTGTVFNSFHQARAEHVAVLGEAAAKRLGIAQLTGQPAIFINDRAFTVVGIISDTQRLPEFLLGIILPNTTAEELYGPPDSNGSPAQMVIETRPGAAPLIARQAPLALRPDNPSLLVAVPPPDPHRLEDLVNADLAQLFLALAGISLIVGTVGIANTTLVAVMERVAEIGLRRSLGARPRHIAMQFLAESTVLGTVGGLVGTAIGVGVVVVAAITKNWTAVVEPTLVLPAPLIGSVVGMIAGIYPSVRASRIQPVDALRQ